MPSLPRIRSFPAATSSDPAQEIVMDLGIFMMPLHPPHRSPTETYREDLDKILLADRLGYSEAWVGQHFTAATEPIASPLAFMAAAIPVTKQITFCTGVLNLPCHHPATVAAECAQFDHLSRGRFIMGIGPGALATDFQLYGNEEGWARLRKCLESIDMIKKIWAGGPPYHLKGEFYEMTVDKNIVPELGTGFMPKQPHPPIASSLMSPSPGLGKITGEQGWLPISANFIPTYSVATHWVKYAEGCEAAKRKADPDDWRVCRNIVVARSDAEARDLVFDPKGSLNYYFSYLWKALSLANYTIVMKANPNQSDSEVTLPMLLEDLVIFGSPRTVAEKIRAFRDRTGSFGKLVLAMSDWEYRRTDEEQSMHLLATEVLPVLRKRAA
jgi:alkanesulfonate monooxygenase SsuD/methylene tetrahydromethanopterin reductase-like flavin-dependent oxidoreductase (luciferase family)